MPAWLTVIPVELWLVIGAFAIPGAWLVIEALRFLPDTLSLLGEEFFGFRIGLALTLILVMVGLIGAGMIAIAWMLYRLDRVGRGLAYVVAGSVILSVIFSGSDTATTSTAETIAAVTAAVGAAILAFSPAVQRAFTGADSRFGDAATSVVIARTAILVFAALAVLVGFTYVLIGTVESKYAVFGALILVAAVLAWVRSQPLMDGDRLTRVQISIAAAVLVLLMIVIGRGDTSLNFPIGLLLGAVAFLWIPPDARRHFGDAPLDLNLNR